MPRTPRFELAGGMHHCTAAAVAGRVLFRDDGDRRSYLLALGLVVKEHGWQVLTFCLMTTHVHLVVRTPEPTLGDGFRWLHGDFALSRNQDEGKRGHLFADRYYNGPIETDRHLRATFRYVARNPVKAGMCRTPEEYAWSAHNALLGAVAAPRFLDVTGALACFGDDEADARRRYASLVALDDAELTLRLERSGEPTWLEIAKDVHRVPIDTLASELGVTPATIYRRIRAARATEGTGT